MPPGAMGMTGAALLAGLSGGREGMGVMGSQLQPTKSLCVCLSSLCLPACQPSTACWSPAPGSLTSPVND